MAQHTITVITKNGGTKGDRETSQSSGSKVGTSSKRPKGLTRIPSSKGSNISMGFGGAAVALTAVMGIVKTVTKGVDIHSRFQEARTGETMRYQNLRQVTSMISDPTGFAKRMIWDYAIIAPQTNRRENLSLNYQRELTGNVIYSKHYSNGNF